MHTLFPSDDLSGINLVPRDGEVYYHGVVFEKKEADDHYEHLLSAIDWQFDEAVIFGKLITTKRKVAWYGDQAYEYRYSGRTKTARLWTDTLLAIKKRVELLSAETYNSCLLNLYHDGTEGMAWHSDGEKDLKRHGAIASVTFGAERKFSFKHKVNGETISLTLEHGSLIMMKGALQDHWLHRLPPTKKVHNPRINLTFRTIQV